jgi:hypothetical protein
LALWFALTMITWDAAEQLANLVLLRQLFDQASMI